MKRTTFLALAMSLGLVMNAGQAGATVANPGLAAAAANAKQTTPVTQVWWRGGGYGPGWHGGWRGGYGPGWRGGWRPGYGWRSGYGWVPFAAFGAAAAAPAPTTTTGPIMVQVRTITAPVPLMAHVERFRVTSLPSNRMARRQPAERLPA
jgi:hypothetical protein